MKKIRLSSEIKLLVDALPLEGLRETPWQIVKGIEPHFKEYARELLVKERSIKKSKNKKDAVALFEDTFLLLGFISAWVIEGYIEALDYLLTQIPELKNLKRILRAAEKISRPEGGMPVAVRYGSSFKVYYKGSYYFKYWINNTIYKIKTEEVFALFPLFYKKEVKNKQLLSIVDKAFLKIAKKNGLKEGVFDKFKRDNLKMQANVPYLQKDNISPSKFHERVNVWIEEILRKSKDNKGVALIDIFNSEFEKLREAGEVSEELAIIYHQEDFYLNIESYFLIFAELSKYVDWIKENDQKNAIKAYVLRDAIGLYENDLIKDLLSKNKKGVRKVVLLNRDMMFAYGKSEYWWEYTTGILYKTVSEKHKDFEAFLDAYYRHITEAARENKDFTKFILKVGKYLEKEGVFENKNILFIDTGTQGSIVLFLCAIGKYMQDIGRVRKDATFDVRLYSVLSYLRKVYKGRYFSNNFCFVGYLEFVKRQGSLYRYIPGSFDQYGHPKIAMGSLSDQLWANIELLGMLYLEQHLDKK